MSTSGKVLGYTIRDEAVKSLPPENTLFKIEIFYSIARRFSGRACIVWNRCCTYVHIFAEYREQSSYRKSDQALQKGSNRLLHG